jgi:hypothetical protein
MRGTEYRVLFFNHGHRAKVSLESLPVGAMTMNCARATLTKHLLAATSWSNVPVSTILPASKTRMRDAHERNPEGQPRKVPAREP